MNAQPQMSGQFSGRAPNQASPQLSGLPQQNGSSLHSQLHGVGAHNMDRDLAISRHNMRNRIGQILQRRNCGPNQDWVHRIPELARRLEEFIFKDAASKEDYMNMPVGAIDQRLQSVLKNMSNNTHSLSHPISSSSAHSTMIPTPGMPHSGSTNSIASCSGDNSMITANGAGMLAQKSVSTGNMLPNANGSAGLGHNASFNTSDGSNLNRYQQSPANLALGSSGNSIMSTIGISRQLSQMIPTPGLNNTQPATINSECSNGVGISGVDCTMVPQQTQHKQYVGSQNSRILHTIGGQMGVGSRSNLQQKPPPYGFSTGMMNGGLGLIGSNVQLVNGTAASEGYLSTTSYSSSPKPSQQQFDHEHNQPMLPCDGYAMNTTELPAAENLYSSAPSIASTTNNQNMNQMSLHSKSKLNHAVMTHNTSLQSMQPQHIKSQIYDNPQKMNFQIPQPAREHLQSQHRMQNFQQQPNQPYPQLVQHHNQQQQQNQQQQSQQQQQLVLKTDTLRSSSMATSFGGQLSEHGFESHNDSIFPQAVDQFLPSELQSQYQQKSTTGSHSKNAQLIGRLPNSQDFHPPFSQGSQQMLHLHQQITESQNDYNNLFSGSQPDGLQQGCLLPPTVQKSQILDKSSFDQHIQEDFQQRLAGQEEAQQPRFEGSVTGRASVTQNISVLQSSGGACGPGNSTPERNYLKQRRWLSFLLHARKCSAPKGACEEVHCIEVQKLLKHMERCNSHQCGFPRCRPSKQLVGHYFNCRVSECPVCTPVRNLMVFERKARCHPLSDTGLTNQINDPWRTINKVSAGGMETKTNASSFETSDVPQSVKRMKVQHTYSSLVPKRETSPASTPIISQPYIPQEAQPQQADTTMSTKSEVADVKIDMFTGSGPGNPSIFINTIDENVHTAKTDIEPLVSNDAVGYVKQESTLIVNESDQFKLEAKHEANAPTTDPVSGTKSGKPKIKGVSLTELFTPEQIREHIVSLRQWVGQSKAKAEKNQAMENTMSENSCQLCAVEKLTFEPPPIYCTPCGVRIKRNAAYYTIGSGDTRHYFCVPCYNEVRSDTIEVDGSSFVKARLERKKNDEETEEWWVQCDKCEAWQHQICALFNGRRNDGGQAEYTCPNCYTEEIEKGERKPLPQSAVLGAKDLPRTILSDHIEQRLFKRLKQEKQDRARHMGKSIDEVPGAEALVIRVVSSVDKKLEVKPRFLEIFQEENYPTEFPYKSKVILLFQKIEGVEVCLFGMYVQEFGSECRFPNQRRVYLSYLDSVKYFRPEIKTVTGEALRTYVYHEILIGYLEYCKKRGFTSCYIWACPPLKGEDYILYCHPEIQKTPKSDKLREWYLSMLRKASQENIVVELTNLHDHFFATVGECKAKVTAARLPYFDGDYWPGAAEDMINQLRQEEDGRKMQKKGKTKKTLTKRALKAAGQTDLTGNASKDALLMQKLGETISPMKEDFIMVHLQHACTHCCLLMVSGTSWVCKQCKNFQLCNKCHDTEQRLEERDKHPTNSREKHVLCPVEINDVTSDTKDKDEILESEFFDTRQAFLSLCQGNHYQYDTLRRAKHSSMMVLYHLHNPTAPAFVTTCNVCHHDIETGQGWRCEICPDFDVCNACYQKDEGIDHPHKLTNHPSIAERDAQNQEARQKRVLQLRKMLDLLVHAAQCRFPHCQYPNCRKVKGLFRHGIQCKTRASGGCPLCKKMWYLLQLHARACKESDCHVPRCKDLKEHLKRLQQQSDSRRRAAVMEMMRQRAAEVAGGNE